MTKRIKLVVYKKQKFISYSSGGQEISSLEYGEDLLSDSSAVLLSSCSLHGGRGEAAL